MKRLFVAIDLPETIKLSLAELNPDLSGARWLGTEQMHLTLGFFGAVDQAAETTLTDRLKAVRFTSFVLPVQGIGTFPAKGAPRIIWIGVGTGHPHLFQIHKRVQEAALSAGLEPDLRAWHPHVTMARCRDVSLQTVREFLIQIADFEAGIFRVEEFSLYSSKLTPGGSVFTQELRCPGVNGRV
jgi:2'-5' RNA ligase